MCFHQGVEAVVSAVRQRFWILRDCRILQNAKSKCIGACIFDPIYILGLVTFYQTRNKIPFRVAELDLDPCQMEES